MNACVVAAALAVCAERHAPEPTKTADVVTVDLTAGALADGLEQHFVGIKVKPGWEVYVRTDPKKRDALSAEVLEYLGGNKTAGRNGEEHPDGTVGRGPDGKNYATRGGHFAIQSWVFHDDLKDAKTVTARVRVTATNGKKRLAESILNAERK